jgi:RimJ/RimL family protein N-acetyltransferase
MTAFCNGPARDSRDNLRLETVRLELIALTAELADALDDRNAAERMLGAAIPDGWPDSELLGLLALYRPWIVEDAGRLGYGPWVVVARDERSVVGSAGFMGKPPADDEPIELGYGVHPNYRNRGYATEATRALLEWSLSQPLVERVVAKCKPDNAPSVRVLEKIGMARLGRSEGMLLWEARPD